MSLDINTNWKEWKAVTLEEIKKIFHQDFYLNIRSLVLYCRKTEKDWTIDIQRKKNIIMIFFVSEDVSWVYEMDNEKSPYFRQIYLARDDLHYLLRRMNEKRKIRKI